LLTTAYGLLPRLKHNWHVSCVYDVVIQLKGLVVLRQSYLPTILTAAALSLILSTPAFAASGSVALPEPSALLLLSMGVAGVAIGRRFSSKRPRD
jgi:hypothetical protein